MMATKSGGNDGTKKGVVPFRYQFAAGAVAGISEVSVQVCFGNS